jgi:hypothetical protein
MHAYAFKYKEEKKKLALFLCVTMCITPKAHSNSPEILSEEIIQYSRTFAPQVQTS